MKEKNTLVQHEVVCFQILDFETTNSKWGLEIKFVENYFFLKNYVTSEGAVSYNSVNWLNEQIGEDYSSILAHQLQKKL